VENKKIIWTDLSVTIHIKSFRTESGVSEHHVMMKCTDSSHNADIQFRNLEDAINRLSSTELKRDSLVFKRYFVSDATNQKKYLDNLSDHVSISIVQQPPLDGTKASVWLYYIEDAKIKKDSRGVHSVERPFYKHLFHTGLHTPLRNGAAETNFIFSKYTNSLSAYKCTLKDNCIRTWIFVQGVDIHYSDMVNARSEFFEKEGLTQATHYIASTGIEGKYTVPQSLVLMDAYSIQGIRQEQIKYLHALTHLSPTYRYGVTFERGTAVEYGDRCHIFISGTASIDKNGEIVHPNDIIKQTERTFENIKALLSEADADISNIAKMIIYLRDTADYKITSDYIEKYYSTIPYVIVWAPVCRPGWLVEIECIALKEINKEEINPF